MKWSSVFDMEVIARDEEETARAVGKDRYSRG